MHKLIKDKMLSKSNAPEASFAGTVKRIRLKYQNVKKHLPLLCFLDTSAKTYPFDFQNIKIRLTLKRQLHPF